jgi:hypothetical protein
MFSRLPLLAAASLAALLAHPALSASPSTSEIPNLKSEIPSPAAALPPASAALEARVESLLAQLTLDEKLTLICGDPTALARRFGETLAEDTLAKGKHAILAPCVGITRFPLGGRNFETLGEDPWLNSRLAVAITQGIQSRRVIPAVKHFAANDQEWHRWEANSVLDERTLHETHLPADFAARSFGPTHSAEIGSLLDGFYRLAAAGKPEQTWLLDYYGPAQLDARLAAYRDLADRAAALAEKIPARLRDAYFQLVLYPVAGAARLNELHLLSRRSLWRAQAGETDAALADATAARAAIPELDRLTLAYTTEIAGGKWQSIIAWENAQRPEWPGYKRTPRATSEILAAQATAPAPLTLEVTVQPTAAAPARLTWTSPRAGRTAVWLQTTTPIYYGHAEPEKNTFWTLAANTAAPVPAAIHPWGNIWHLHAVGPQWTRVGEIDVLAGENTLAPAVPAPPRAHHATDPVLHRIHLGLTPPPPADPLLVVPADAFTARRDGTSARTEVWLGLGPTGRAVSLQPFTAPSLPPERAAEAPALDYEFPVPAGATILEIRTLPTQRIHPGREVRYTVAIDDAPARVFDIHTDEFTSEWQQNVLRGTSVRAVPLPPGSVGLTLRVRLTLLDPGVVLDSLAFR